MNESTHTQEHRCIFCEASEALRGLARQAQPAGEAGQHFRQARIELLQGIRSLIDRRIDALQKTSGSGKGTTIQVE